jgi:hypothetical protein
MNYTELVASITDYVEAGSTQFLAQMDTFIRQAEERIFRAVMIPELRKNATTTLSSGSTYLARPSDMLSVFSLATITTAGVYNYLINKDVNFIREAYPDPAVTGVPKYYAQFDGDITTPSSPGHFIIGPPPSAEYQAELHYFYDPPSIVVSGTSWLGDNAEAALLYGSIMEAYRFNKGDPDLMAAYQTAYDSALNDLRTVAARSAGDAYRNGVLAR